MENSMEVPQKIKNRSTIRPNNFTTGYLSKENENTNLRRYMHPGVYSSVIYNSQIMEAIQVSINRWMDKEAVVCVCTRSRACTHTCTHTLEYYMAIKRWDCVTWDNMDGPRGYYAKWISQTERDKYYMIPLICRIKKKKENKWTNKKQTET